VELPLHSHSATSSFLLRYLPLQKKLTTRQNLQTHRLLETASEEMMMMMTMMMYELLLLLLLPLQG